MPPVDGTSYRWLEPGEIEELVNPALASRGWSRLNINPETPTARVLGAWKDGSLVEFFVLQLFPVLGPLLRVDNLSRDNGDVSRELARRMEEFLREVSARGVLAIADSPLTERLCQRFSMTKIESPVYLSAEFSPEVVQ